MYKYKYKYRRQIMNILNAWNKHIPYIRPCYSVSRASSPELLTVLRQHNIPMICHNSKEARLVNHNGLTVMDTIERSRGVRGGGGGRDGRERIIRSMKQFASLTSTATATATPIWIHTSISNDALDETRRMFEYVWANKYILNGIVFDISNFSNPIILPSIYSYKIALDYVFRNMIHPFYKEYNIVTPAIMMDARDLVTSPHHLFELHEYAMSQCKYLWGKSAFRPKVHLQVDRLFDSNLTNEEKAFRV